MSEVQPKIVQNDAAKRRPKLTYRGVELQTPFGKPTRPVAEIKRAVDTAFAKHAHRFAKD